MDKKDKKKVVKKYIFISFIIFAIVISILLTIKYNVEGDKEMPYVLSKISIRSALDGTNNQSENLWDINLSQINDVIVFISKNENVKSDEKIKSVKITNKFAEVTPKKGTIKMYLPTSNDVNKTYVNHSEDCISVDVEYIGNVFNNYESREIAEDGGFIAFRISNEDIANYVSNDDLEIAYNKSLLEKAQINEEEISFTFTFDLIIETTDGIKYKGTVKLDLPVGSFENSGIINQEITDFSKVIFKRTK